MAAVTAERIPAHWLSGKPPYQARREEQISLAQFVLLSMLVHALAIMLFGAPSGGSPEGRAMWGSIQVTLPGFRREEPAPPVEVAPAPLPPVAIQPPAPPKVEPRPAPKVEPRPEPKVEAAPPKSEAVQVVEPPGASGPEPHGEIVPCLSSLTLNGPLRVVWPELVIS